MPSTATNPTNQPSPEPSLEDGTYITSVIIEAHLMAFLSTPSAHLTWPVDFRPRLGAFLTRVARFYPHVRSACSLRALLVVLRYKASIRTSLVAFNDDAELLFYIAFAKVARRTDRAFSDTAMLSMMQAPVEVAARFWSYRNLLNEAIAMELSKENHATLTKTVKALYEWYMVPYLYGRFGDKEALASLVMPVCSPAQLRVLPSHRYRSSIVFPAPPFERRKRFPPIAEDEETEGLEEDEEDSDEEYTPSVLAQADSSDSEYDEESLFDDEEEDSSDDDLDYEPEGKSVSTNTFSSKSLVDSAAPSRSSSPEPLTTAASSNEDPDKTPTAKSVPSFPPLALPTEPKEEDGEGTGDDDTTPTLASVSRMWSRDGGVDTAATAVLPHHPEPKRATSITRRNRALEAAHWARKKAVHFSEIVF